VGGVPRISASVLAAGGRAGGPSLAQSPSAARAAGAALLHGASARFAPPAGDELDPVADDDRACDRGAAGAAALARRGRRRRGGGAALGPSGDRRLSLAGARRPASVRGARAPGRSL